MKQFHWRLQRILDVKEKAQKLRRNELLQLAEQLAAAKTALLGQKRILRETLTRLSQGASGVCVSDQALAMKHASVNDSAIQRLESHIRGLVTQHEAKKAEVVLLRREKEGLERLREKAFLEHVAEQEKRLRRQDDDRNNVAFMRRQQSEQMTVASEPEA